MERGRERGGAQRSASTLSIVFICQELQSTGGGCRGEGTGKQMPDIIAHLPDFPLDGLIGRTNGNLEGLCGDLRQAM